MSQGLLSSTLYPVTDLGVTLRFASFNARGPLSFGVCFPCDESS